MILRGFGHLVSLAWAGGASSVCLQLDHFVWADWAVVGVVASGFQVVPLRVVLIGLMGVEFASIGRGFARKASVVISSILGRSFGCSGLGLHQQVVPWGEVFGP